MATANSITNSQPAFTWLFLSAHADLKASAIVLRTQADTEAEARRKLSDCGDLVFAAKIRTESPLMATWADHDNFTLWTLCGSDVRESVNQMAEVHHA